MARIQQTILYLFGGTLACLGMDRAVYSDCFVQSNTIMYTPSAEQTKSPK